MKWVLLPFTFCLLISSVFAGDYILQWRDNSDNEDGFVVLERIGPGNAEWNVIAVTTPDVTSLTVTIPNDNTRYCWRVQSYNQAGAAQPSNVTCQRN